MSYSIRSTNVGGIPNHIAGMLQDKPFLFRAHQGGWVIKSADTIEQLFEKNAKILASGADPRAGTWTDAEARAFLETQLQALDHA